MNCLWFPSQDEELGPRALGYVVLYLRVKHALQKKKTFGGSGHSYSHLLIPLLEKRVVDENLDLATLLQLVDTSSASEKLMALFLVVLTTIGIETFPKFLQVVVQQEVFSQKAQPGFQTPAALFWALLEDFCAATSTTADQTQLLLSNLRPLFFTLMYNTSLALQKWFLFFALPSSFFRHVDQETDIFSAGQQCITPQVMTSVNLTAIVGSFAASWTLTFPVKDRWARFPWNTQPGAPQAGSSSQEPQLTRCEMGFQVGDLVQFDISWENMPAEMRLTVIGLVLSRTLHKSTEDQLSGDPAFDRVEKLDLLVTFVPQTEDQFKNLEAILRHAANKLKKQVTWTPQTSSLTDLLAGFKHFHTYLHHCPIASTSQWTKLANSSLPVEWHELFNLPDNVLPLLYSTRAESNDANADSHTQPGVSAPQPNQPHPLDKPLSELTIGQDRVDLTPFWFMLHSALKQLQPAWADNNFENFTFDKVAGALMNEADQRSFLTDLLNTLYETPSPTSPLFLKPGLLGCFWPALLALSPRFARDLAAALLDHNEVTLSFFAHFGLHYSANRLAAFVQGVFGAGKTFTTAMFVFLTQIMLGHKTLWVSHNNKPLEEAAKCFNSWIESCPNETIKEILFCRFKRYLGSSQL